MPTVEEHLIRINASTDQMRRELDQLRRSMRQTRRTTEDQTRGMRAALASLRSSFVLLGGTAVVRGLGNLTQQAVAAASEIGFVADRVGVSVEALQELRFAAEQNGSSMATLDMALQRFSRRIGEAAQGTGVLRDITEDLGIALRNADGTMRRNEDLLEDYAAAIASAESEQEALRLAFQAFDSEGASLLELMRQYPDAMRSIESRFRELGFLTNAQVRDAQQLDEQLGQLSTTIDNNLSNALLSLGPLLVTATGYMADLASFTRDVVDAVDQLPTNLEMQWLDTSQLPRDWLDRWENGTLMAPGGAVTPTGLTFEQWFDRTPGQVSAAWGDYGPESGPYRMRPYTLPGTPEAEADLRDRERAAAHAAARQSGIEWLGGTTNVTTDPFAALPPWERPSASSGAGGGGRGNPMQDRLNELRAQIDAQTRLNAALLQGEGAYRATEAAIEAENEARRLGIDLASEEGAVFLEYAGQLADMRADHARLTEAMRVADAAVRDYLPGLSDLEEAQAALNEVIEAGAGNFDQYAEALEAVNKQQEDLGAKLAHVSEEMRKPIEAQIELQDEMTDGVLSWADAWQKGGLDAGNVLKDLAERLDEIVYKLLVRPQLEEFARQFTEPAAHGLSTITAPGAGLFDLRGLFGGFPGFAGGGSFTVGPASSYATLQGVDNRLVPLRLRDGEQVTVEPAGGSSGRSGGAMAPVTFNFPNADVDSFRRAAPAAAAAAQSVAGYYRARLRG